MNHGFEKVGDRDNEPTAGQLFTRYVRSLDPHGEPPDASGFHRVWDALRGVLARELRRRGLWRLPPHFLGFPGWQQWTEADASRGATADALDELTADGYAFIFVDRVVSLRTHAQVKPNIEGLVFLNVQHFIHELQQRHDPLGSRMFQVLQSTVREMVDDGALKTAEDEERISSRTVLVFRTGTAASETAAENELRPLVERWGDDLLPALVTTLGQGFPKLVARVRQHVLDLERQGIPGFALGTLAGVLAQDIRRRWAAVLDQSQGEKGVESIDDETVWTVPLVPPDTGFEARQSFRRLVDCVARELAGQTADDRTRDELEALWDVLIDRTGGALESDSPESESIQGKSPGSPRDPKMPSRREMARLLGIPRDRLSGLYAILGTVVSRCGETGKRPAKAATDSATPPAGEKMDPGQLREQLRQATGLAMARSTRVQEEAYAESPSGPRPGDVFVLRESSTVPIEWLVLDIAPENPERCRVIPADTNPLTGPADVAVPASTPGGPLTLRCAFALSLPRWLFEPELRSRHLPVSYVEQARSRQRPFTGETPEVRGRADTRPAYRDWVEEIADAAQEAIEAGRASETSVLSDRPREPKPQRRLWRRSEVLAAALAVLSLGLSALTFWQQRQIGQLAEPFFEPSSEEIVVEDDPPRGPITWRLPAGTQALLLDVVFVDLPACTSFRVEFLGATGRSLWSSGNFERPMSGESRLVLPRAFLVREPTELHLFGRCEGTWRQLLKRPVSIEWR